MGSLRSGRIRYCLISAIAALLVACGSSAANDDPASPEDGASSTPTQTEVASAANEGSDGGGESAEVTVMIAPNYAGALPLVVAQEEEIFADHGITMNRVAQPTGIPATQGFAATDSDVGLMTIATAAQGWQAGDDIALFCGALQRLPAALIAAPDSDIPTLDEAGSVEEVIAAFEGRTMGIMVPVGAGMQLQLDTELRENGVTEIDYVSTGTDPAVVSAAFDSGSIDVAQLAPPGFHELVARGDAKFIMDTSDIPGSYQKTFAGGWFAPRVWLEDNEELAAEFCTALDEAHQFILDEATNEVARDHLISDTGVSEDIADHVIEYFFAGELFGTQLSREELEYTFELNTELGVIASEPEVTYDSLVFEPSP